MAGEAVDMVIDPGGLIRTQQALQTLDKYLERLQWRSQQLNSMRISPVIQIIDRMSRSLDLINMKLLDMTSKVWSVSMVMVPVIDDKAFASAGTQAGETFTNAFLTAFDTQQIADKAKSSLDGITVNAIAQEKNDTWDIESIVRDIGVNVASEILLDAGRWGLKKFKQKRKATNTPNPDDPSGSPTKKNSSGTVTTGKNGGQEHVQGKTVHGRRIYRQRPRIGPSGPSGGEPLITNFLRRERADRFRPNRSRTGRSPAPHSGFVNGFSSHTPMTGMSIPQFPESRLLKSTTKLAGKVFRPLSVVSDIASIASAKPGTERNKAIGGALGGWGGAAAGAAIGSMILPGVGTLVGGAIGGIAGSSVGEAIGGGISKVGKGIGKLFGWGGKQKQAASILPESAPNMAMSSLASARPGTVRKKAIIGSMIMPGVGTLVGGATGGIVGSSVGEAIGSGISKVGKGIGKLFGWGGKKTQAASALSEPAPNIAMPSPSIKGKASTTPANRQTSQSSGAVSINLNLPTGAVQLTVQDKLNYDEISAYIGRKITASIQQAMENRA